MANYLPDIDFTSGRVPLDRSFYVSQRYDPNNLSPLTILQDAFNKYIASNNNTISEVCLMVEYKQTANGNIKTMFITKDTHNDINAEFHGENPDGSGNPIEQLWNGRRGQDSRYYSVNSYSDFATDISNFNILSITLCEVYNDQWVSPIKVLYINRPNDYRFYHRAMAANRQIAPGHQVAIPQQQVAIPQQQVVIPQVPIYRRSRNALRTAYNVTECPICLGGLDDGEDVCITVPCNHLFHCGCIAQNRGNKCPVCRTPISSIEQVAPEDVQALAVQDYKETGLTLFGKKKRVRKNKKVKKSKSKIPSKIKKLAKKLKIKLTYKKNGKRMLKSLKLLKKQIKQKIKKVKKIKKIKNKIISN